MSQTRAQPPFLFTDYLRQPDVYEKLVKNRDNFLSQNTVENKNSGNISRCFNDLPNSYPLFHQLLSSLPEAVYFQELDVWVDLAVCYALNDLFDIKGRLRPHVNALLSLPTDSGLSVPIETLNEHFGKPLVNRLLLGGYINLLCDLALNTVIREMQKGEDTALKETSPWYYFSSTLNKRVNAINDVDSHFIIQANRKIEHAIFERWLWSVELRNQLVNFLDRDTPSITDQLSTLFSTGKKKAQELTKKVRDFLEDEPPHSATGKRSHT